MFKASLSHALVRDDVTRGVTLVMRTFLRGECTCVVRNYAPRNASRSNSLLFWLITLQFQTGVK